MPATVFAQTYLEPIADGRVGTPIPVEDRNPARDARVIDAQFDGFRYYEAIIAVVDWNRQDITTQSEPRNRSNVHYVDATVRTMDDISTDASLTDDRRRKILDDMESAGCKRAVVVRSGRIVPFAPTVASIVYTS